MTTIHSRFYLVAFAGWLVGWVAVLTSSGPTGLGLGVAVLSVFCCNAVIFALALLRVQRGDAWGEAPGTLGPVVAEFLLMQLGLRLPAAVASLRN